MRNRPEPDRTGEKCRERKVRNGLKGISSIFGHSKQFLDGNLDVSGMLKHADSCRCIKHTSLEWETVDAPLNKVPFTAVPGEMFFCILQYANIEIDAYHIHPLRCKVER